VSDFPAMERTPYSPPSALPAGEPDGDIPGGVVPARLDSSIYQDQRWCANCGGARIFVDVYETDFGRVRICLGCGEENVVRFSRTTEAA
jgi:hypothetical protein